MATLSELSVSNLALKGAGETYNYINRFFATKAEADAALADSSWEPVAGKLNACLTGDQGFFVYNESTSTLDPADTGDKEYIDAQIAAVQADVDQNESDADSAIAAETSARTVSVEAETTNREAAVAALQALIDALQTEADARNARLTALEVDPTTAAAVAAVQADVDQNESDSDAAIAVERGRIDAILDASTADKDSFAEIVTLINSVDTTNDLAFAGYVTSNDAAVAAVQADVDQNEADADAADAALSARLDALEVDPTTAAAVAAVQADVDQNESDADAAIALKAPLADPTFTGDVSFGSLGRVNPSGNELKFLNDSMSTGIVLGNKITLQSNTELEVFGDVLFESGLIDAADDTAAAAAGVDVNQLYRNGSVVMIRVS